LRCLNSSQLAGGPHSGTLCLLDERGRFAVAIEGAHLGILYLLGKVRRFAVAIEGVHLGILCLPGKIGRFAVAIEHLLTQFRDERLLDSETGLRVPQFTVSVVEFFHAP